LQAVFVAELGWQIKTVHKWFCCRTIHTDPLRSVCQSIFLNVLVEKLFGLLEKPLCDGTFLAVAERGKFLQFCLLLAV
jgi:hypothetical protein